MRFWQSLKTEQAGLWCAYSADQRLQVIFTPSDDRLPEQQYVHCLVDLAQWERYWQQDICHYVPDNPADYPGLCCESVEAHAAEVASHDAKIARWVEAHRHSTAIPALCFAAAPAENGFWRILQGRHRLAYWRRLGLTVFAAAIPRQVLHDFQQAGWIVDQQDADVI